MYIWVNETQAPELSTSVAPPSLEQHGHLVITDPIQDSSAVQCPPQKCAGGFIHSPPKCAKGERERGR